MEELGVRPNVAIVNMMGNVFKKLGMLDKYHKLKKKYPRPKWEYKYIKGKRVRIRAKEVDEFDASNEDVNRDNEISRVLNESEEVDTNFNEADVEAPCS